MLRGPSIDTGHFWVLSEIMSASSQLRLQKIKRTNRGIAECLNWNCGNRKHHPAFCSFFSRGLIDHAKYYCIWCLDNMLTKGKWFLFVMEVCLSYQAVSVTVINYLGTKPMQHRTVSSFFSRCDAYRFFLVPLSLIFDKILDL